MRRTVRLILAILLGTAAAFVVAVGAGIWSLLPPRLPTKSAPELPKFVAEALWLESRGVTSQLVRVHLGSLVSDGSLPLERTIKGHFREMALLVWLNAFYTRAEQTNAYGAAVWMGNDRFGLESGAQHYFRKNLAALSPGQVAVLVAIIRSPKRYDPACHADRALRARDAFLSELSAASLLDASVASAAAKEPLDVAATCDAR